MKDPARSQTLLTTPINKPLVVLFVLVIFLCDVVAQDQSQSKRLAYKTPGGKNGFTLVSVNFSYKVINTFGTIQLIYDATCTGNLVYQYKGREFTFTGQDAAIRSVKVFDPVVTVQVTGPNNFRKIMTVGVSSGLGGGVFGNSSEIKDAKTNDEKNPANYIVSPVEVTSVSYDKVWDLQSLLDKKLKLEQTNAEVVALTAKGDREMLMQNYAAAQSSFNKVLSLDKNHIYASTQLSKISKESARTSAKKRYNDLVTEAKKAEADHDYNVAERLYKEAGTLGEDDNGARAEAGRMQSMIDKLRQDAKDQAKKIQDQAIAQEKSFAGNQLQKELETRKELEKRDTEARQLLQEKVEAVTRELEAEDQARYEERHRRFLEEENRKEREKEEKEKLQNRQEALLRRSEDDSRIRRIESIMSYDPIQYARALAQAQGLLKEASLIDPSAELQLKKEWWDNNVYMERFADDLYEKQRRQNHWNYMLKKSSRKGAYYEAKEEYISALRFVDKDSPEEEYLYQKIEYCHKRIDWDEETWKSDFQSEGLRIKMREQARSMAEAQKMVDNRVKADLAYAVLDSDAAFSAQYLTKKYELAARMNEAGKTTEAKQFVNGLAQATTINAMMDDNKDVALVKNSFAVNANIGMGGESTPMLVDETNDLSIPSSNISALTAIMTNFGLDFWLLRSDHLDINLGGFGSVGVGASLGFNEFSYNGGGKVNVDFGVRRFKIATSFEYLLRNGNQKIDHDVASTPTGSSIAANKMSEGKYSYSVLRFGGGFKIDISDDYSAGHIQMNVFAEKPDFYPGTITKNPVYSYQFEFMSRSNLYIRIGYANKYVVAGERKYPIYEQKNKDYFLFQFGKYWTLIK